MFIQTQERRFNGVFRLIISVVLTAFVGTSLTPQRAYAVGLNLPVPGTMMRVSDKFMPPMVRGIKVDPNNPLLFNFLIEPGQLPLTPDQKKTQYRNLIKYFLASLTTPEKDMWVNLSPYEHNRIIADNFRQTEMGRDMLAQDYILKQLTASLIYPEESLGKKFWNTVYERIRQETGSTTKVPVNTFNKVWIMADKAEVFEHNQTAFVVGSHLKVMLEEDYLALQKHSSPLVGGVRGGGDSQNPPALTLPTKGEGIKVSNISSQIVKEIILPELEKEVNTGKNFANLRQIFNSIILSSWYKNNLKSALLNQVYANHSKVKGIDLNDPTIKQQIYDQYLKAYKKGVFNYIKEDINAAGVATPKKYFSGGLQPGAAAHPVIIFDSAVLATSLPDRALVSFQTGFESKGADQALIANHKIRDHNSNGNPDDEKNDNNKKGNKGKWWMLAAVVIVTISAFILINKKHDSISPERLKEIVEQSQKIIEATKAEIESSKRTMKRSEELIKETEEERSKRIIKRLEENLKNERKPLGSLENKEAKSDAAMAVTAVTSEKSEFQIGDSKVQVKVIPAQGIALHPSAEVWVDGSFKGPATLAKSYKEDPRFEVRDLGGEDAGVYFINKTLESNTTVAYDEAMTTMIGDIRGQSWAPVNKDTVFKVGDVLNLGPRDGYGVVGQVDKDKENLFFQKARLIFQEGQITAVIEGEYLSITRSHLMEKPVTQLLRPLSWTDSAMTTIPRTVEDVKFIAVVANHNEKGPLIFLTNQGTFKFTPVSYAKRDNDDHGQRFKGIEVVRNDVYLGFFQDIPLNDVSKNWRQFVIKALQKEDIITPENPFFKNYYNFQVSSDKAMAIDEAKKENMALILYVGDKDEISRLLNLHRLPIIAKNVVVAKDEQEALQLWSEAKDKGVKIGAVFTTMKLPKLSSVVISDDPTVPIGVLSNVKDFSFQPTPLTADRRQQLDDLNYSVREELRGTKDAPPPDGAMAGKEDKSFPFKLKSVEMYDGSPGTTLLSHIGDLRFSDIPPDNRTIRVDVLPFNIKNPSENSYSRKGYLLHLFDAFHNRLIEPSIFIEPEQQDYRFILALLDRLESPEIKSKVKEIFENSKSQKEAEETFVKFLIDRIKEITQVIVTSSKTLIPKEDVDKAVLAFPGGIDLNTTGMGWKLSKDGQGVEMNIDQAMIEKFKREGMDSLTPVIFKITPIVSIWPIIGLLPPKREEERLAKA
ncbi:MAG: hypothetical protein HQL15_00565 [Candidatus Omnitrophica bacterium]|nr:hypothetical protein [Candidatus Omnitrophota bacterium]